MKKAVSWLLLFLIVLASPTQAALLARNWAFDHSLYQGKNRLTGHNDQNDNLTNNNGMAFTSNGADQLTKAGSTALAYNGAGQATSVGQWAMKFAYNDQIKSITGQGLTASYLYDGNGQRVQKTVNGVAQNFLWNGGSIAKEYKPDGSVRADYQLGAGAKIDGKWQFYLSDIQGSTLGVTDDTGKVIATWSYSDYGVTTQTSGDKNLYQPFLYTHSELDSETGFYHNKARHYGPRYGKFFARDSIVNSNLYSYCNGDPINLADPSGRDATGAIMTGLFVAGSVALIASGVGTAAGVAGLATELGGGLEAYGLATTVYSAEITTVGLGAGSIATGVPLLPVSGTCPSSGFRTLSRSSFGPGIGGVKSFTGGMQVINGVARVNVNYIEGEAVNFRALTRQIEQMATENGATAIAIRFTNVGGAKITRFTEFTPKLGYQYSIEEGQQYPLVDLFKSLIPPEALSPLGL